MTREKLTTENIQTGRDNLLASLVSLTRIHHKPTTEESLIAGLPLRNGRLDPSLFSRAAQRANLVTKETSRPLSDISDQLLPVVLILKDDKSCILLEQDSLSATIIIPGTDEDSDDITQTMSLEQLQKIYTNTCIYAKPMPEVETSDQSTFQTHWFWATLKKSRGIYSEVLIASLMINLFALVSPLFIMNVYDRVVPNYAVETLWVLASGALIVFIFDFIMKSLRGYFIDVAGKRADILLSSATFAKVMDIKMDKRPGRVGSFANNLQEFDSFREFFTSTTLVTIIDLPFVVLFLSIIFGIGGSMVMVPMAAIPIILFACIILQKPLRHVIQQSFTVSAKKHAMLVEALSALDAIKGARAEGIMQQRWENFNAHLAKLGLKSRLLSMGTINFTQTIQQTTTIAVVIYGVYLIMEGQLSVGGLIACTILTGRCLAPMGQVAGILTRYHHSLAAYKTIDNIMSLPVERPAGKSFLHRNNFTGSVEFKAVNFTYPGQNLAALQNLNCNIQAGEKIAIVGKMGSGKSTLQRLIMNFYQPTEGSILFSATDINQIDPTDLRRNIVYVPQDIVLLSGTVRENIVLGSPMANDNQIMAAAKLAGLDDFINRHPQGFDLQVGERGLNLSGGQRQAVAIARAFITDAPLMVLDEPTNSMDNTAELHFTRQLKDRLSGKTLILVTHKTTMLSLVDRIIVLNDGQIVADGPKDQVLQALAGATHG
ncbi:MAG: type I secretion system permease/ATPase [Pseudomonadales bacterium]|nr:type I secretion system permease/ATPase [Pseudomonadales bacterium]